MNNKKKISIIAIIVGVILIGLSIYFIFTKEDKNSTLTLIEKQWIEANKNNVIDMSIVSDVPVLSYNGEGLIVDFLNSLNEATNLSFNKISYNNKETVKTEYAFKIKNKVEENDILIYEDNYVILTKNKVRYNNINELSHITIGVLNENLDSINNYLFGSNINFKTFSKEDELLNEFNKNESELDAIVLLKTINLKTIFDNNYTIAYNITEYKNNVVLSLGSNEKLNTILVKYYNKWKSENYTDTYNKYLSNNYFLFNSLDDSQVVKFRSKRYVYGFLENAPYDATLDNKLAGINNEFLSSFSDFANIEISYKHYKNVSDLLNSFNSNNIDFFYGVNASKDYKLDVFNTLPVYDNDYVILKHPANNLVVNSLKSLSNNSVYALDNSKLFYYLKDLGLNVIGYDNDDSLDNIKIDSFIVVDTNNYNYHVKNKLKDYIIAYNNSFDDYNFVIRDISDNKVFSNLINFYISFNGTNKFVSNGLKDLLIIDMLPIILKKLAVVLGILVILLIVFLAIIKAKPKSKKTTITKEDKLRYIDTLTSLKNRNYLNDKVEEWDESSVYPQTIVIIDLNNIAYINDNYGHAEGDSVIEQAASILIAEQLENSEIVRTNGNEFLIYMVGFEEKQVITYIRKLSKELKELKHGFGAAIGYSVINDAIKTIDDAINEATTDMRNNKEEANN